MTARPDWLTDDDIVRMEQAHVRAWPALETQVIDGWLCRRSGGGSQRANSVSTVAFTGLDPAAALDRAEQLYRSWKAPARFHTFDLTQPDDLAARLQARSYRPGETTLTMFKRLDAGGFLQSGAPDDVAVWDGPGDDWPGDGWPGDEWLDVYLGEISESRRVVNALILRSIPAPRAFFLCRRNNRAVSTALCVVDGRCAVVECVATRKSATRQGGAIAVLAALEAWAARQGAVLIGLQVVVTNAPAVRLYQRLGYEAGAENRFFVQNQ